MFYDFDRLRIHSGIEALDFNNGQKDTIHLDIEDILTGTDNGDLFILGDDGQDRVIAPLLTSPHRDQTDKEIHEYDGVEYVLYTYGDANLFIETGLLLNNETNTV